MKNTIMFLLIAIVSGCGESNNENKKSKDYAPVMGETQTVLITDFGANGDGITDNYAAFIKAAAYAAKTPNTTIIFQTGTYYISKYRTIKNDTINHIYWKYCQGLKIIGEPGTVVSVNGSFERKLDYITPSTGAKKSYTNGIAPFWFFHCTDLEIKNIEVTGNVQNTTREPGIDDNNPSVTEGDNILLRFTKCDNVTVESVYVHHAESDGIMVSGDRVNESWVNSTNISMTNVRSEHNGRQGISIGGLSKGYFKNCQFSYNGFTDGSYGRNDPSAGVDIEPGEFHNIDNIKFDSCTFQGNFGGHFLCTAPASTSRVTLLKCSIITVTETIRPQGITILAKNTVIDGCVIKLGTRTMKFTNKDKPGSTTRILNSEVEGSDNCISSNSANRTDSLYFQNNHFTYTRDVLTKNFISLQTRNVQFLGNRVWISAKAIKSRPKGNHVLIERALISKDNTFYSDETGVRPRVSYTGTRIIQD